MRKALVVGIDHYNYISKLFGCVNDANTVASLLARNENGSRNFDVLLRTGTATGALSRVDLKDAIRDLFSGDDDVALLYFAGHGHVESTGGYLCASDCHTGDDGVPLSEIVTLAARSRSRNKIIILDSCHSGIAGNHPVHPAVAELMEGMTILTASATDQYAEEVNGKGVFTTLLADALSGAAANLIGEVTPGGVYAHIDQSLGSWAQRPIFKTNVKNFVHLRKVKPPIPHEDLVRIRELFPAPNYEFLLDPEYEPESPNPDPKKNEIFAILQKYNRVNLLVPIGAPHMWHAAMQRKSCKLTLLGEHYRHLVEKGLI